MDRRGSLSREWRASCLLTKGQEHQANNESERSQRNRGPDRVVVSNAGAHQKSYPGAGKTPDRSSKGKGAGPAFGAVLFRQPECIHRKVSAAHTQPEQTDHEPGERVRLKIKDIAEAQRNKRGHQSEKDRLRKATPKLLGQNRQQDTADDRAG